MPAFCFHLPRFSCFRRSRCSHSPKPSSAGPRDDKAASHLPCLGPSSALSPRPSSRPHAPGRDVLSATGASHPPAPDDQIHLQASPRRLRVDKTLNNFSGQPSQASRSVAKTNVVIPNSAPTLSLNSSMAQQPTHRPYLPNSMETTQSRQSMLPQHASYLLTTPSQQPLFPERLSLPSGDNSLQSQHQNRGLFDQAHDFSTTGNATSGNVDGVVRMATPSNQFMEKLLQETIPGAASDSSPRGLPPRCHPGTRLAVLRRCIDFISNSDGAKQMRWIVGVDGVGKSAIMRNVARSPKLPGTSNASVFFSINGRNDGTKAVMTLTHQLAAKSEAYRRVIEQMIARDPSLLQSSMPVQFEKFIVQPFIHNPDLNSAGRVLIIIDGLDECSNPRTQLEFLRLISNLCILYPSSPVVWLIASRPETHITSFFSRAEVTPAYEKEEIPVDSDEGRADVERFLCDALEEIRKASGSLDPQWPDEQDLWKLANAAGGLFAYAHFVIRYISDSTIGSPASQFSDVLHTIDNHPLADVSQEEHSMALLHTLYGRILSSVPSKVMINTRKLLLALALDSSFSLWNFVSLGNWLNMTPDEAYAAINQLRSVLRIPRRDNAHQQKIWPFHKSFIDYISDFTRSGFSSDILHEARQLQAQCAYRILKEASDGIDFGNVDYRTYAGTLVRGPGTGDKISLTWLAEEDVEENSNRTRLNMYKVAIEEAVQGMQRGEPTFQSVFGIRVLTTAFEKHLPTFPLDVLRDLVFDEFRRDELMTHEILKQIPLNAVDISTVLRRSQLQFRRSATTATNSSDPWNLSCEHEREGEWEEGKGQNWTTTFEGNECSFCLVRLKHQFKSCVTQFSNHTALILFTSTGACCVEFRFVDVEDGISEWTYRFWCRLELRERRKYGSTV